MIISVIFIIYWTQKQKNHSNLSKYIKKTGKQAVNFVPTLKMKNDRLRARIHNSFFFRSKVRPSFKTMKCDRREKENKNNRRCPLKKYLNRLFYDVLFSSIFNTSKSIVALIHVSLCACTLLQVSIKSIGQKHCHTVLLIFP